MIRRLLPASLAGQLMLVTALALMCAQAINFVLLVGAQRNERLAAIAGAAAAQIGDASERIGAGQPVAAADARDSGLRPARWHRRVRLVLDARPHIPASFSPAPDVVSRVRAALDDAGTHVRDVRAAIGAQRAPRRRAALGRARGSIPIVVAAQLDDGRWLTIRARAPAPPQRIGGLLVAQTLVLFALMLGPLLWTAWRVTRPLARLAAAARDTRPGGAVEPVTESGPEDVRALTRAFNAMHGRIMRLLEDKDRMLGAVGHDLRTPLASLRVRIEQVEDTALRDRMVATIADMTAMLEDILALARVGHEREPAEPTDLAALLANLAADYAAMDRPVTLADDGPLLIRSARPASLRRALRNLIDNALAYGGSARLGLNEAADGRALLMVDDDGCGIPADAIEALMQPFARGEQSRNRETGGSGLGLTLARSIAAGEGGDLTLANRPGGGLRATISLPRQSQTYSATP